MTNYNDGKWHGWNGGECPVHPNSRVEVVYLNGLGLICGPHERSAACHRWHAGPPAQTIAFRVIKEHREPREFWIVTYDGSAWDYQAQAIKHNSLFECGGGAIIHAVEKQP